jgi:hypothetical protein
MTPEETSMHISMAVNTEMWNDVARRVIEMLKETKSYKAWRETSARVIFKQIASANPVEEEKSASGNSSVAASSKIIVPGKL